MPQVGATDPRASPGAGAIKASESRQRPAVGVPGGDGAAVSVSGRFPAGLADDLPRRGQRPRAWFRAEAAARSRSKELANGDRCLAFPGPECRYYVLLCDGMGTGLGAAQEGQSAGSLLRQMLTAGFPAAHALRTLNSILALRGSAGAVTVDLAELYLDTGHATLYKWGAAPSWLLRRGSAEK
ncbi:MAG: SpoIIE family protein phosphatase [Oscillospiraceae bacterium]